MALEQRRLLTSSMPTVPQPITITVNNPTDTAVSGEIDFSQAVTLANHNGAAATIDFDPTVFATPQTIMLPQGALLTNTAGLVTINGPAASLTLDGGGAVVNISIIHGVEATISGLTITGFDQGGLYNTGTLTASDCTFSGNSAQGSGGGITNFGSMTLLDCTISGNTAQLVSGGGLYTYRGGITTLTDCTVSGNVAGYDGGGIGVAPGCSLQLTACTVSGNSAGMEGGGLANFGTTEVTDTIVAGNSVSTTSSTSSPSDIISTGTISGMNNLIGTGGSGGLTNGTDGNIVLGSLSDLDLSPLGDYGGPTDTMALLPASAAIGMGIAVNGVTTDERGVPVGSTIDIGAFQASLVVESTSDSADETVKGLTLPGAIDLADQFAGASITFDPALFGTPQTISLTEPLELSNRTLTTTIIGPAVDATISGGGISTVFDVESGVTASLSSLTISDGNATAGAFDDNGGGISNSGTLAVTGCMIIGNSADGGGGVYNSGNATFFGCTISNNTGTEGGGLCNIHDVNLNDCTISGNVANQGAGGGLFSAGNANLTMTDCTISGNSAGVVGGGIYNRTLATLTDCTLSGNHAEVGGGVANEDSITLTGCTLTGNGSTKYGGGALFSQGTAMLTNCTVSGNESNVGGGVYNYSGITTLTNTIVAGNTITGTSDPSDILVHNGSVSGTNNLVGIGGTGGLVNGQNGNIVLTSLGDLDLAPLDNNGGPTQTMALLPGSPAIGMGATVSGLTTDQRGVPIGALIDIGAFQTSLVVESTLADVNTTSAELTLPGAVSLADQYAFEEITFDPTIFGSPQTITLGGTLLDLTNTTGASTITGPTQGVTVDANGLSRVFRIAPSVTATISGLTISGGTTNTGYGKGGGIYDFGTLTLDNCTVSGNYASFAGGGLYTVLGGSATLNNCTVTGNQAIYGGGGVFNSSLVTLTLLDCTVSGNQAAYGGGVVNNGEALFNNCTFSANHAGNGAGIANSGLATITNCTISDNVSNGYTGGGVFNNGSASLSLSDCSISGNSAADGGGVASNGSTTVNDCTISDNTASKNGGGLYNHSGTLKLTDCTVSGNAASRSGGGVYQSVTLTDCTVSGNEAPLGGGLYLYNAAATLTDTIVAGNTVTGTSQASDITGENSSVSGNNNLVGPGASGGLVDGQDGNIVLTSTADLRLAPLGNYGGPNQTMALLPGSAAIGAGVAVSGVTSDERGVPLGTVVDIGAFETSLVIESTSGTADTTSAGLTLPGAVSLADEFAGEAISFDPTVFAMAETITLSSTLELDNPVLSTTITGPKVGVTVDGNDTCQDIGIANASVSLFGLTITAGDQLATLNSHAGGGVGNLGTLVMTDCTVTGDLDGANGGGLYNNGTATLVNCRFSEDSAGSSGGAIFNNSGTLTLTGCTIGDNSSASNGGGISNYGSLSLTGCIVSGNSAMNGSGGGVRGLGTIALTDSTISGNSATYAGGGVSTGGTITLTGCTINGNSAGDYGGGIANVGPATLTNCTISGNSATDAGGGLFNYGSTGTLTATTISGNIANVGAGIYVKSGAVVMTDTIVAGNSTALFVPSDLALKNSESGKNGTGSSASISGNNNLIGTGGSGNLENGVNGNIVLTSLIDLGLAPLGNYGGPTETMALLPGSPALGEGVAESGISSDQRGLALAASPDIGAFQSQGFVLTVVSGGTPQSAYGGLSFGKALSVQVIANNAIEPVAGGVVVFSLPASGASAELSASTAVIGDNGVASVNATAGLTGGSYTVTASSPGASTTAFFALTNEEVTITLTVSASNPVFGPPVTLSATGGLGGGRVTFFLGSTALGTSIVDASGTASLTVANLPVGTGSITAGYVGDSPTPAVAETAPRVVTVAKARSSITLRAIEVLKRYKLSAVGLDVAVTGVAPSVSGVPTGAVTFELMGRGKKKKAKILGVKSLSNGMAVLSVKPSLVGKLPLEILYGGDEDFLAGRFSTVVTKRSLVL